MVISGESISNDTVDRKCTSFLASSCVTRSGLCVVSDTGVPPVLVSIVLVFGCSEYRGGLKFR